MAQMQGHWVLLVALDQSVTRTVRQLLGKIHRLSASTCWIQCPRGCVWCAGTLRQGTTMEWHPARPARPSSNAQSKVGFHFYFLSIFISLFALFTFLSLCLSLAVSGLPSEFCFHSADNFFFLFCLLPLVALSLPQPLKSWCNKKFASLCCFGLIFPPNSYLWIN